MGVEVGARVGAVASADSEEVRLYGFGVYDGEQVPPPGVLMMGIDMHELGVPNPQITLDSGKRVFGCECWWGGEERVKEWIDGRRVVEVDIEEARVSYEGQD